MTKIWIAAASPLGGGGEPPCSGAPPAGGDRDEGLLSWVRGHQDVLPSLALLVLELQRMRGGVDLPMNREFAPAAVLLVACVVAKLISWVLL